MNTFYLVTIKGKGTDGLMFSFKDNDEALQFAQDALEHSEVENICITIEETDK